MGILLFSPQIFLPCLINRYFLLACYPLSGEPSRYPLSPLPLYLSLDRSFLAISEPSLYFLFSLIHVLPPFRFGIPLILLLKIYLLIFPSCPCHFYLNICRFSESIPLSLLHNLLILVFFAPIHPYVFQLPYPFPFPPGHYSLR